VPPTTVVVSASAAAACGYAITRALPRPVVPFAVGLLLASHVADMPHFIRNLIVDCSALLANARLWLRPTARPRVLEPHRMRFRCWPGNMDRNAHMNNAKYNRITNYARRAFWQSKGAWDVCSSHEPKANMLVTAMSVRFRKEISFMEPFDVVTELLSWDASTMYVEHRFVRLSDEFIYAICIVKYRLVCADKTFTPATLLAACDPSMKSCASPPHRDWLQSWIDYDQLSSAALRPKKTA